MRAKTILTVLFLISLAVASVVILRTLPIQVDANANIVKDEILVAAVPLQAGIFIRAEDLTWASIARATEPGEIVRPSEAARRTKPEIDEETRASLYGAAVRPTHTSRLANRSDAAGSSSRSTATFYRLSWPLERGPLLFLSSPERQARACCFPATAPM
jgi:Flp pilus assembly protein CpaB